MRGGRRLSILAVASVLVGCASTTAGADADVATEPPPEADVVEEQFPDVVDVELTETADGVYLVAVTLSSPYDRPDRYADAWRILAPDGVELGVRELLHDHASEQPFTRTLADVAIPADVDEITVQGRDQVSGWGGATVTVAVP